MDLAVTTVTDRVRCETEVQLTLFETFKAPHLKMNPWPCMQMRSDQVPTYGNSLDENYQTSGHAMSVRERRTSTVPQASVSGLDNKVAGHHRAYNFKKL